MPVRAGGLRMVEARKIDEEKDKAVVIGRVPFEMEEGMMYKVVVRGLGEYEGGYKVDFETGEYTGEKIRNVGLVVCDPEDSETEYIISEVSSSVAGNTLARKFGKRDDDGVLWLADEWLNKVIWIGYKTVVPEGRERGYKRYYVTDTGEVAEEFPEEPATVGVEQREAVAEEDEVRI